MEIAFIHLVTLKCYVDKRNNVYHQLTFFMPLPLFFVEIIHKRTGGLLEALQYDISFLMPKTRQIKKILKNLVICPWTNTKT